MGLKTVHGVKQKAVIKFLGDHYAGRLHDYLHRIGYHKEAYDWAKIYLERYHSYIDNEDFGENDGKFTSFLNIYSGLAAYEILRENGFTEREGIRAYNYMCAPMRKIGAESYKAMDKSPDGFEKAVKTLTDDMDGPKSVCWDIEEIERSENRYEYKIHRCLYYDVCKAHGYPEFTQVFCAHDHYAFDVLKKHVKFIRFGAIGDGDKCCHDVFVRLTGLE